ncbi:MAG: ankyrin repeat domain-containing protein [Comamonas sp.]
MFLSSSIARALPAPVYGNPQPGGGLPRESLAAAGSHGHAPAMPSVASSHCEAGAGHQPCDLMAPAWNDHGHRVAALRQAGANSNIDLLVAVDTGRGDIVAALLRAGADANFRGGHGMSALMLAAARGHGVAVNALVLHGADINAYDDSGWTATMYAVASGNVDAVNALMRPGNRIDSGDATGMTALMLAAGSGQLDIVNALLKADTGVDIDIDVVNEDLHSAVMLAARNRDTRVVQALRNAGADIDADLLSAVQIGTSAMVRTLLRAGADANAVEGDGTSAMGFACARGRPDILRMLHASQTARDLRGDRPPLATISEDEPDAEMPCDEEGRMNAAPTCSSSTATAPLYPALESSCGAMQECDIDAAHAGELVLRRPAGLVAPHQYA